MRSLRSPRKVLSLALALCAVSLVLSASPASAQTTVTTSAQTVIHPPIPPLAPFTLTGSITGWGGYGYNNYQVNLTASNGWDVTYTPYYIRIYDTPAGSTSATAVATCGFGFSCSATVKPHAYNGGDSFQARIERGDGSDVVAISNTVFVNCQGTGFDDSSPYCYMS